MRQVGHLPELSGTLSSESNRNESLVPPKFKFSKSTYNDRDMHFPPSVEALVERAEL